MLFTPDCCGRCEQCVLGFTPYRDEVVPEVSTAIADSLSGATIKPVLTFAP